MVDSLLNQTETRFLRPIGGVQPIPWDSNDKEIFDMLDEIMLADKEKPFKNLLNAHHE